MSTKPFRRILIANRGEIAVRIIRACHELGIAALAVYSEVDRAALHVRKADEAYLLGPAPARESYLNIEKIIAVAKASGADAIHPGYGFLSENAAFVRACDQAGITFIGPPASAMEMMGSKTRARQAMQAAGVPLVPGSTTGLAGLAEARQVALSVGYPIMLKAAAGGGGKGMRLVHHENELQSAYEGAASEALRAFNSAELYIERFIVNPRHIEVQLLADQHGHAVYLGERECSVQRRHQKVIEEAPSAVVDPDLRRRMGEVAVEVARVSGYTNAGTVEFLVDAQKNFYFLEMNTRLQVEHPVTELVTGLDLVHLQLHIAAGQPLPFAQSAIQLRGHALECRIYAEDPGNNFFPSPGKITRLITPAGPGIREDSGVYEGWSVPLDYDPMLSKLIAYAPTRPLAIARMLRALDEYFIGGIKSNLNLFRRILSDPDFRSANIDTGYLDRLLASGVLAKTTTKTEPPTPGETTAALIAAALYTLHAGPSTTTPPAAAPASDSAWKKAAREEGRR